MREGAVPQNVFAAGCDPVVHGLPCAHVERAGALLRLGARPSFPPKGRPMSPGGRARRGGGVSLTRLRRRFSVREVFRQPPVSLTGPRQIAAPEASLQHILPALRGPDPAVRSGSPDRSENPFLEGHFPALMRLAEKRHRGVHHEMRSHPMTASLSFQPSETHLLPRFVAGQIPRRGAQNSAFGSRGVLG